MYCAQCGAELKDDARFCAKCGAPTIDAGDNARGFDTTAPANSTQPSLFSEQMEADRRRSRRKMSPLMIIALVLALIAGTALAAVLITSQPQQAGESTEQVPVTNQQDDQQEAQQEAQQELSMIDGWWRSGSAESGNLEFLYHLENGRGWQYDTRFGIPFNVEEIEVLSVEHSDAIGVALDRFLGTSSSGADKAGYHFIMSNGNEHWLIDDDPTVLHNPTRIFTMVRIDAPEWAPDPGSAEPIDQSKIEAAAMSQAQAEGKLVFTGTVEIVDTATRQAEVGYPNMNPTDVSNPYLVILIPDQSVQVNGRTGDNRDATRNVESIKLANSSGNEQDSAIEAWLPYNGQTVTIAADSVTFPTDTSMMLANCIANDPRVIAPIILNN